MPKPINKLNAKLIVIMLRMTMLVLGLAFITIGFANGQDSQKPSPKSKPPKTKKSVPNQGDTLKMEMPDGTTVTVISKSKEGIKNLSKVDLSELLREYGGLSESLDSTTKESKLFYAPQAPTSLTTISKPQSSEVLYTIASLEKAVTKYQTDPSEENKNAVVNQAQSLVNQAKTQSSNYTTTHVTIDRGAPVFESVKTESRTYLGGGIKITSTESRVDTSLRNNRVSRFNRAKDKSHYSTFNIDFGFSNWLKNGAIAGVNSDVPYQLSPIGSRYVSLKAGHRISLAKSGDTRIYIQTGLDATWYNFMFQKDVVPERTENGLIFSTKEELGYSELSRNKITNFFMGVPLIIYAKDVKNFNFGIGAFVGYRLLSYRKIAFVQNGKDQSERLRSDYFTLPYQYGVRGQVGYKGIDLFVNYNLTPTFTKSSGLPDLNTITFGIEL